MSEDTSTGLVLYYNPMSRAAIAHYMLEEIGAPYRIELVSFDKREHKNEKFLAINPMGKLPTLVHRGVVVTEAAAICAYLADAFPQAGLAPAVGDPQRGTYYRWMFFAASCVEYDALDKSMQREGGAASRVGYGTYEDTMNAAEKAVTPGPWILGDKFSAADVYLASQLSWGMMVKSIEPRPAFVEYEKRFTARPAYARVREQAGKYIAQLKG
jgi:glutathione S-transferase